MLRMEPNLCGLKRKAVGDVRTGPMPGKDGKTVARNGRNVTKSRRVFGNWKVISGGRTRRIR